MYNISISLKIQIATKKQLFTLLCTEYATVFNVFNGFLSADLQTILLQHIRLKCTLHAFDEKSKQFHTELELRFFIRFFFENFSLIFNYRQLQWILRSLCEVCGNRTLTIQMTFFRFTIFLLFMQEKCSLCLRLSLFEIKTDTINLMTGWTVGYTIIGKHFHVSNFTSNQFDLVLLNFIVLLKVRVL